MKILIIEPYFTGSHRAWVQGYAACSSHHVDIITLPGRFWKWRMHGGAVTLARKFRAKDYRPDLILAGSMLDLSVFLSLTRNVTADIPVAVYFHENQLAYPWQETDRDRQKGRDVHYGFINYTTALCADHVFFNSHYNMRSFFSELPRMLKHFPDFNELDSVEEIKARSSVLHLGIEFPEAGGPGDHAYSMSSGDVPVIVWNHRWEYDKNPSGFFDVLIALYQKGLEFQVILLGESFRQQPDEFLQAINVLGRRVLHAGFAGSREEYVRWLSCGNLLPVTSFHDFFGVSVCEAIYAGCLPMLPRRLAYPEIIPEEFHHGIFYDTEQELRNMLAEEIMNWRNRASERMSTVKRLKAAISRFSWDNMAPVYDRLLYDLSKRDRRAGK